MDAPAGNYRGRGVGRAGARDEFVAAVGRHAGVLAPGQRPGAPEAQAGNVDLPGAGVAAGRAAEDLVGADSDGEYADAEGDFDVEEGFWADGVPDAYHVQGEAWEDDEVDEYEYRPLALPGLQEDDDMDPADQLRHVMLHALHQQRAFPACPSLPLHHLHPSAWSLRQMWASSA